jgi:hypothetical protein
MKCINRSVSTGYCPFCRTAANMIVTVSPRAIAPKDGKKRTIIIKTYHCEACGSFVRSEKEEEPAVSHAVL